MYYTINGDFMKETIYTIPVNEAFDKKCGCPLCSMADILEENEIERITGAAMMEPDVRIETNKKGFCHRHFDMMYKKNAVLPLGLILESHIDEIINGLNEKKIGLFSKKKEVNKIEIDYLNFQNNSCYVCDRIEDFFKEEIDTIFLLYKKSPEFRDKVKAQPYFCLPHLELLLRQAPKRLSQNSLVEFSETIINITKEYLKVMKEDVSWFCKKFDYRYQNEDWKNSKDSIPRAIKLLTSKTSEK